MTHLQPPPTDNASLYEPNTIYSRRLAGSQQVGEAYM